ncbi:MAG: hypothetical protein L0Y54_08345 [Sporichthyaceae bacterium]|nr:hypothetical protein [Sporichthyaceae bacterium]
MAKITRHGGPSNADIAVSGTATRPADAQAGELVDGMLPPAGDQTPLPPGPPARPSDKARKADWVAYAVAVEVAAGVDEPTARAKVEPLSKAKLIEEYGG